ncbi:hypothetical protein HDU97_005841 [Phlyctochytrium planicorne]|nr:hypothetical protein HDU97_005841 [Phlyctochytrium planicorne]
MTVSTLTQSPVTTAASAKASTSSLPTFVVRKSKDRGAADHGWLDSKHTFSFAGYYDRRFQGFGPLRVLNEDKVAPVNGFGAHPHREYEIFSYIVSGFLQHRDSMGNVETLPRGSVQFTSAGTGIMHSEMNNSRDTPVHFLQLWAKPNAQKLKPSYATTFTPEQIKTDPVTPVPLIVPIDFKEAQKESTFRGVNVGKNLIGIHQDLYMFSAILSPNASTKFVPVGKEERLGYLHVVESGTGSAIEVIGRSANSEEKIVKRLEEGDGLFISALGENNEIVFNSVGSGKAEFVLLEMTNDE